VIPSYRRHHKSHAWWERRWLCEYNHANDERAALSGVYELLLRHEIRLLYYCGHELSLFSFSVINTRFHVVINTRARKFCPSLRNFMRRPDTSTSKTTNANSSTVSSRCRWILWGDSFRIVRFTPPSPAIGFPHLFASWRTVWNRHE